MTLVYLVVSYSFPPGRPNTWKRRRHAKRKNMIAVIELKGKQFRVAEDMVIRTLRVEGEPGDKLNAGRVLATIDGENVEVGVPVVEGTSVELEIVRHAKSPKIKIHNYRKRTRTNRRVGYREKISYLRVKSIG